MVQENLMPHARDDALDDFHSLYFDAYIQWKPVNVIVVFEFAMFMWAEFKAGRISSKVWATVLAVAWQSGSRGMLACVVLNANQVREMFKAADFRTLLHYASFQDEDMNEVYDSLPDTLTVYRGVSTGISHFEDGFSWTRDPREPFRFAALNCQTKKEIPGFLTATIKKESVLALFSFEGEVVVDPNVPKPTVDKHFLRGTELRQFHKRIDVEANSRDLLLNWAKR